MSCNRQRGHLWGGPSNFPVDGGKLVGQVAYYHFSIRRANGTVRACSLACVRVNGVGRARARPRVTAYTLAVSPFGIRQGYRGCSGVLVVIGVGRTDHLNTRHRNHDRAPSLFLAHFLTGAPSPRRPDAHLPIVRSSRFLAIPP